MNTQHLALKIGQQVKAWDNKFTFKMTGIADLQFSISSHCITRGQEKTWKGITGYKNTQTGCTITVKAGRSGSKAIANWFREQIGNGSAIGCATYDALPRELNFAFKGTLSFSHKGKTYTGSNIVLAQGHNGRSRNNWWIGGDTMSQLTNIPFVHLAAISQNFSSGGILPARVFFVTFLEQISSMEMGLIDVF